jgi:MFS family permease
MGRSEDKKDVFGDKYVEHRDNDGRKIGTSEDKRDVFGDHYTQHYDTDRDKSGASEDRRDVFGDKYTQHYDNDRNKSGRSEEKRDIFGDEYTQHFDRDGRKSGHSVRKRDVFGDEYVEHYDADGRKTDSQRGPARRQSPPQSPSYYRSSSNDETPWLSIALGLLVLAVVFWAVVTPFLPIFLLAFATSQSVGGGAGVMIGVVIFAALLFALWKFRHFRAVYFFPYALVLQALPFILALEATGNAFAAALIAAIISIFLFRLCFSALRWRAPSEEGERADAWVIAGGLAVLAFAADITLSFVRPNLLADANAILETIDRQASNRSQSVRRADTNEQQTQTFALAPATVEAASPFIAGEWQGVVAQSDGEVVQHYSIALTLFPPDANGAVQGNVSYPDLHCAGQWQGSNTNGNSWQLQETTSGGKCDASVFVSATLPDDQTLIVSWQQTRGGADIASATLHRVETVATAEPITAALAMAGGWSGAYEQNGVWTEFSVEMQDGEAGFTGSLFERMRVGRRREDRTAQLQGAIAGREVTFLKTYDGGHSVEYRGQFETDDRIFGEWRLPGASGRFWMER